MTRQKKENGNKVKFNPKNKKALENLIDWLFWIFLLLVLLAAAKPLYKLFTG